MFGMFRVFGLAQALKLKWYIRVACRLARGSLLVFTSFHPRARDAS